MGDAEGTVKRFYVQTLEPGVGKKWFDVPGKMFVEGSAKASRQRKTRSTVSMTN